MPDQQEKKPKIISNYFDPLSDKKTVSSAAPTTSYSEQVQAQAHTGKLKKRKSDKHCIIF